MVPVTIDEKREAQARDLDETRRLMYIALAARHGFIRAARLHEVVGTFVNALAHHGGERLSGLAGIAGLDRMCFALSGEGGEEASAVFASEIDDIQARLDALDGDAPADESAELREAEVVSASSSVDEVVEQVVALILDVEQTGAPNRARRERIVRDIIREYDNREAEVVTVATLRLAALCRQMIISAPSGADRYHWRSRYNTIARTIGEAEV